MWRSGSVRPKLEDAASNWSGAWRRRILVAASASRPDGDLGRGGAVVGLGAEVGRSVGDADVGHAVGTTELEAGLEVPSGVAVAEQCPRLVDHLHPLWPGPGHELGQPAGSRHHHQGQRLGVDGHGRQVEHDPRPVPPQRHGGGPVEHAPQRPGEQLVEGVAELAQLVGKLADVAPQAFGDFSRRPGQQPGEVGQGRRSPPPAEVLDDGEDGGVLDLGEGAVEDGGGQGGDHLRPAQGSLLGRLVR